MILIGQYDSPFVRRVGVALTLYGFDFEHRPWSSFGDADLIRAFNPLTRVPTLVLDDGMALIDSHLILDYLDNLVGPERAMFPTTEPARHLALKVAALATGLADKAVSLFYERRMHQQVSEAWVARHIRQIESVLAVFETDRAQHTSPFWFGNSIGHVDIAITCALRFLNDAHPGVVGMSRFPTLSTHAQKLEATPVFQSISQAFIAPV